jgi:hypothetical protein
LTGPRDPETRLGWSARRIWGPLAERTRAALEPGETAREMAVGRGETASWTAYLPGSLVFVAVLVPLLLVLGDGWIAFVAALVASTAVDVAVRRRQGTRMVSRELVTVTDRRLLRLTAPDRLSEIPLDQVTGVDVRGAGAGFAALIVRTAAGEETIEVSSDWPRRTARAAASALAAAVDRDRTLTPPPHLR